MSRFGCLVLVLIASVLTAAEPQQFTVWKLDAGYYVVSGSQIVAFPPGGPVVPPVDPVVPPTTDLAKAIVAEIDKLPATDKRHTAAMKLTATYQMLAGQVKDGKIHPTNAVAAADLICPIALGTDGKAWAGVFSVVNAAVGKAGTAEATAAVFDEAAAACCPRFRQAATMEASGRAVRLRLECLPGVPDAVAADPSCR